jgi:hypothetical protein
VGVTWRDVHRTYCSVVLSLARVVRFAPVCYAPASSSSPSSSPPPPTPTLPHDPHPLFMYLLLCLFRDHKLIVLAWLVIDSALACLSCRCQCRHCRRCSRRRRHSRHRVVDVGLSLSIIAIAVVHAVVHAVVPSPTQRVERACHGDDAAAARDVATRFIDTVLGLMPSVEPNNPRSLDFFKLAEACVVNGGECAISAVASSPLLTVLTAPAKVRHLTDCIHVSMGPTSQCVVFIVSSCRLCLAFSVSLRLTQCRGRCRGRCVAC